MANNNDSNLFDLVDGEGAERLPWWRRILRWLLRLLLIVVLLAALIYGAAWLGWLSLPWSLPGLQPPVDRALINEPPQGEAVIGDGGVIVEGQLPAAIGLETAPIQRADTILLDLKVAGKLEYRTIQEIKAPFEETIESVNVQAGDRVAAGDVIAALDRQKLATELGAAWRELSKERQALGDLVGGSEIELLEAKAELSTAREELEKLSKGPTSSDSQSAQLAISEAQLAYDELLKRNDPNSQKVREARYALRQAELAVQDAQTKYNAVSWRGDVAASSEAAGLKGATLSLESAQRTYDETIKPPTELEVQKAQLAISKAQAEYDKLFVKATPAQIEQAQVRVAKAADKVRQLEAGPSSTKVQDAEAKVVEALTKLESVRTKLLSTSNLQAPFDGQIVKLSVKPGQLVKQGDTIAAVAAPNQFKLTLPVSELSILRIHQGMEAQIVLEVLPNEIITGVVTGFAPIEVQTNSDGSTQSSAGGSSQLTTYPVIVAVSDSTLSDQLRAGMSAQVTFVGTNLLEADSWLVPLTAIQDQSGESGTIQVLRGDTPQPLTVKVTEHTWGEWAVVVSAELQEGDLVVGTTTSCLDPAACAGGGGVPGPGGVIITGP